MSRDAVLLLFLALLVWIAAHVMSRPPRGPQARPSKGGQRE